jgi:hypothetical protein
MAERTWMTGFNEFSVKVWYRQKCNEGNILKYGLCTLRDEGCASLRHSDV